MAAEYKLEVLRAVEGSVVPVTQVLAQLQIPRSSYYRWRANFRRRGLLGLRDRPSSQSRVWNQILPEERDKTLEITLLYPEWVAERSQLPYYGPLRVYDLRVLGLSDLESRRADPGSPAEDVSSGSGISSQNHLAKPAMADRRDVSIDQELGLVLPDLGTGRLQSKDPGLAAAIGHDGR